MSDKLIYKGAWNYSVRKDFVLCTALSCEARMLFVILKSYCRPDDMTAFPGTATLAKAMGKNRQTIEKYNRELVAAGCLEIAKNREAGKFKGNIYTIIERTAQEIDTAVVRRQFAAHERAEAQPETEPTVDEKTVTGTADEKTVHGSTVNGPTVHGFTDAGRTGTKSNQQLQESPTEQESPEEKTVVPENPAPPVPAETQELIRAWFGAYRAAFGVSYKFQGRDGPAAKEIMATNHNVGQLIEIARKAWQNPTKFNCKQASSLAGFAARFNEIVAEVTPAKATGEGTTW